MRTNKLVVLLASFCLFFFVASAASAQGFNRKKPAPTATTPPVPTPTVTAPPVPTPTATTPPRPNPTGKRPPTQPPPNGEGGAAGGEGEGGEDGNDGGSDGPPDTASPPSKWESIALWVFAVLGSVSGLAGVILHFRYKRSVEQKLQEAEAVTKSLDGQLQKYIKVLAAHRKRLDVLDGGPPPPPNDPV